MPPKELSEVGKEQVAFALILLKDAKSEGRPDVELTMMILGLADHLGVRAQYDKLMSIVPPMKMVPR